MCARKKKKNQLLEGSRPSSPGSTVGRRQRPPIACWICVASKRLSSGPASVVERRRVDARTFGRSREHVGRGGVHQRHPEPDRSERDQRRQAEPSAHRTRLRLGFVDDAPGHDGHEHLPLEDVLRRVERSIEDGEVGHLTWAELAPPLLLEGSVRRAAGECLERLVGREPLLGEPAARRLPGGVGPGDGGEEPESGVARARPGSRSRRRVARGRRESGARRRRRRGGRGRRAPRPRACRWWRGSAASRR